MTAPSPQQLIERALAASPSDEAIVIVRTVSEANLRWARNTLTTNGETTEASVGVVAVVGDGDDAAAGTASGSGSDNEAVATLAALAHRAAVDSGPAEDARPLVADAVPAADWEDPPDRTSSGTFATLAPGLAELFRAAASDGIEHYGYTSHRVVTTYLGTSTGLRLRHVQPEARLELTAKSHARTRSAWVGRAGRDLAAIDLAALDVALRERLRWQGRTVEVPPGRHPAILAPSAVSDLMIDLYWSAGARDAAEGHSVFAAPGGGTRLGEQVAPESVTLRSDPDEPGLQCAPFVTAGVSSSDQSVFDNGLPLSGTAWIDNGVLAGLIATRAGAARYDVPLRPAVDNLVMEVAGASGTLADVVDRSESGLLVTCLWYNRVVDPRTLLLTGLTRDGVYVVEGGEIVGATTNFRFNESPVSMLPRITDAGTSVPTLAREMGDYFTRCAAPPLRVDGFNFSTVSQAS
jgi:predicted Zn-dependent protease